MGALLGLGVGIGLLLIMSAFVVPRPRRERTTGAGRVQDLLVRAGLGGVRPASFVGLCVACALLTFLVVLVLSQTVPVAVVFAAFAANLPVALVRGRALRRQREFAEVWPEAVDNLTSAVRAGMSLPESLSALANRGPEPLRPAFSGFALDYQVSGQFGLSLDRLKDRLADPVGDRVVESLRIAREVGGGDLGRLLRSLSRYLRDEARTRSELEARQAWSINAARLAVAAPWLVLLLLCLQEEVIHRYATTAGAVVLAVGAVLCVFAYRVMMRIGRLPTERRILS